MFEPSVITAPTKEPVSRAEVRTHLRLPSISDEDSQIDLCISAARRWIEKRTGRTIHQTDYEYTLDEWPTKDYIVLPRATPLVSITSLKYLDQDGVTITVAISTYIADTFETPGRLVLAYNESWPSGTLYPVAPIRVRYRAGIASSPVTEAEADIKLAALMLVGGLWENRETEVIGDARGTETIALRYGVEAFLANNIAAYVF